MSMYVVYIYILYIYILYVNVSIYLYTIGVVLALARFRSAALHDFVPRAVEINIYKMYENMRTNETCHHKNAKFEYNVSKLQTK